MKYCADLIFGKAFCIINFFYFPDSRRDSTNHDSTNRELHGRGMTWSASIINSDAHSFRICLGSLKSPAFFNFPVSCVCPEKVCDFHCLQLRLSATSIHVQVRQKIDTLSAKEGKGSKKTQGCALL